MSIIVLYFCRNKPLPFFLCNCVIFVIELITGYSSWYVHFLFLLNWVAILTDFRLEYVLEFGHHIYQTNKQAYTCNNINSNTSF